MSYIAREAREELLETVAHAAEEIGAALALVEAAYELLDEGSADRLEEQLFRPVQGAYGRAGGDYDRRHVQQGQHRVAVA